MEKSIKIFEHAELGDIRVIQGEDNEPWFVAKDICETLGFTRPSDALRGLDSEEKQVVNITTQNMRGNPNTNIINESGLYSLILRSRKPEAKKFKKWVTSEVLPTIRKHGIYATEDMVEKMLNDPTTMIKTLERLRDEREKRVEAEKRVAILSHVNKTYTATEIAKECNLKSAIELNKYLHKKGIQFKQNGTWVLYSCYADKGYVEIKQDVLDNGRVIYNRRFTQMGREFVLNLMECD